MPDDDGHFSEARAIELILDGDQYVGPVLPAAAGRTTSFRPQHLPLRLHLRTIAAHTR
jgi:hypothetical protein